MGTPPPPVAILLVSSHRDDALALEPILARLGYPIFHADSAAQAVRLAVENPFSVAIVVVREPSTEGFRNIETLRRNPAQSDLPVILAGSSALSPDDLDRLYRLGNVDFVTVPASPAVLQSKARVFAALQQQRRQLRERIAAAGDAGRKAQPLEERLRLFLKAISDYALIFLDANGTITEWSRSAEQLLGYRERDVLGRSFRFLFTAADQKAGVPELELERARAADQSTEESDQVRADGTILTVVCRTVALRESRDGAVCGYVKIVRDASHQRRLRESEAKFRHIFETANEGIWILNPELTIETANQRMAEILGYELHELIGRKKYDFAFPEDVDFINRLFDERRTGKIQTAIEVRFRHKNGQAVWTLLSARPLYQSGGFAGALDMFTDVTARHLAENRLRVFFESSSAGHALIDPATKRFLAINRRFCEITGRNMDDLRGLTFTDITHPDDREPDERRFEALYRGALKEITAEKRYLRPDGATVWVHLTSTIVRTADGTPEVQVSVVQDITARKAAEAELIESRTRLRLAVEAAELGVFFHDGATGTVTWDERLKELIGLANDEAPSLDAFLRRIHPEDQPRIAAEIERILAPCDTAREFEFEYRVLRPDGSIRWLRANGVNEPGNGRNFRVVGTMRDVTTEKEFESELRRQIAERTRELEDKTRQVESLCYTVAHDLRAPLRAINGYADYALEELGAAAQPPVVEYLDRIRNSTRRLDALVNDLLAFSRIDHLTITPEPIDLQQVTQTVLHELQPEIQRRGAKVTVQDALPRALGEQSVIEQVVHNLVSNALKFTAPDQPPDVDIFATSRDGVVRLSVRDRGLGIPKEYQQRIFKVFERLQSSRAYPGTGIGLAIVAKGVERLGG
jgi:PAS domain S-box-containing protein